MELLQSLAIPEIDHQNHKPSFGESIVDRNTLDSFLISVMDQRKQEDLSDLCEIQLIKYGNLDASIYLPPFFFERHNAGGGKFISPLFSVESFPEDAIDNPGYLYIFDKEAKEKGIDTTLSGIRDVASSILFTTHGTHDNVLAMGEINGLPAPVSKQARTNIADRAGKVLIDNIDTVRTIAALYSEFQETLTQYENIGRSHLELGSAIYAGLTETDEWKSFKSSLFFITVAETPERESIAKKIYEEACGLGRLFDSRKVYTQEERTVLGLDSKIIEGEYKVL